jgi:type III restriction enzyme
MPRNTDRLLIRNEDLVLKVSQHVNRSYWDETRYEEYIDELCQDREYQKEAIRTALRYLLGRNYADLRALARANYDAADAVLEDQYGSWATFERNLQLPTKLSASLDLATGTGKSFVLYGIAAIMLAEGAVDRVLVLCPSTTIETGLITKFRELAANADLRDYLPADARISTPHISNATESIIEGTICVENYHAILDHVKSSIRDSLKGNGERTLVLNDEAHHVANESDAKIGKWKQFLLDPDYGFHYIIGVSGTCYKGDEYFTDVIYRYSLRKAMEEGYVKDVDYIDDMPTIADIDDKWQLIRNRHEETKAKLRSRSILPLTIIVTKNVNRCRDVADELKAFLIEKDNIPSETASERVLVVHNNAPDVLRLPYVDLPTSRVEWIVSVSMLNEGWDVKRVFQIVPHEERAFNSKLLIAQVLGRGLRIPDNWGRGAAPKVTVFNHEAWAHRIKDLVREILEREKRLSVQVLEDSPHHFDLHNINYTLQSHAVKTEKVGGYTLFDKGYIELPADSADQDVTIEFEQASNEHHYKWQTRIQRKTYTAREIAIHMYQRLESEQDPDDPDPEMRTYYTDRFPVERLEEIVRLSLARRSMTVATDSIRQKFLQSLGILRRKASETVRYMYVPNWMYMLSTRDRHVDSVSAPELRRDKFYFFTPDTRATLNEQQYEFFDEATESGSGFRVIEVRNVYDFKTPLNAIIADSQPEKRFIDLLLARDNVDYITAWIKSTVVRFYEIDYMWRRSREGEHTKKGKFSPDFFIRAGNLILVVEIKGDEEITEPAEENFKKNEYALAHFKRLNEELDKEGNPVRYKFNFLTPKNFSTYFQYLRRGDIWDYESELDVRLAEEL